MCEAKIYLEFDETLQQVMADNQLTISDILRQESIQASVISGLAPFQNENGARSKELVTIILASSVLIGSIGFVISRVLNEYYHRPIIERYYENVALRDESGNVLLDKEGNQIFKIEKRREMIQPREMNGKHQFEANFNLETGLLIKFNSEVNQ